MTEKELSKLRRADLLEMVLEQSREVERLETELAEAQAQLSRRQITIDRAGSIAEAALELSGIFEAAQTAVDQYIDNVKRMADRQEESFARREEECERKEKQCEAKIRQMIEETERQCAMRKENLEKKWIEKIRSIVQECDHE